ncbi:MAG: single-stranded-DNA-specific exonuclease RecJ [Patescibacteria group bacterium]|nr:single-stranded-DNA-specific exonuclease RecJ [Patescibacteria group bacterium]
MIKTWKILSDNHKDLLTTLLVNRGLKTKKEQEEFLHPVLPFEFTAKDVGIKEKELKTALKRIGKAIKNQEQIVVYGDYDCDGICATAIMWITLHNLGAKVLPFIPDRVEEGYGLSVSGLNNLKQKIPETKLIITVDHGIVAAEQTDYAQKKLGWDVIISDHHTLGRKIPKALAIVHTTKLAGSGVAWFLAQQIISYVNDSGQASMTSISCLDLAALGTIADLVPLQGPNRSIAKFGLEQIHQTKRIGLLALIRAAGLIKENIETYEIGYILAPRLNALGRIDNALDALRLLCTNDAVKANRLAQRLNEVNGQRQTLTEETTLHAKQITENSKQKTKLLFISHETYNQGVIGLVAGRLVEEFYLPAIVVAKGEEISKGSARSITGFNIVEAIRNFSDLLVGVGGHPMAAGFTVETKKLELLEKNLKDFAQKQIAESQLSRELKIDCELKLSELDEKIYQQIEKLRPFGMANPEPVFMCEVEAVETRLVGNTQKHLKLRVCSSKQTTDNRKQNIYDAIAFNFSILYSQIKAGDKIKLAYNLARDTWNGKDKLQLRVRDIKI